MEDCEKITDWSIGHLQEEEEEDDDDDCDDDPYSYDDAPASYDVAARLKEINAALSKQVIPDDSGDQCGHRRVKFHDNPVAAEIPPDTHFDGSTSDDDDDDDDEADDEDEEEDDGYGDSTEVSDEPEDFSSTTTSLDVVKSSFKRSKSLDSESPPPPPNVTNPSIERLAVKLAKLVSTEAIKWHSIRQTTDVDERQSPLNPIETTNTSSGYDAAPVEVSVIPITHVNEASNTVEVSQSSAVIEHDHVSSKSSNESVESFEEPSEEEETKDELAALPLESVASAPIQSSSVAGDDSISEKDSTAETTRVLEARPSTRPIHVNRSLKHNTVEETMVMSSEGKFHIVSMDDFRRTSSAFGGRPSMRTTTTLPRMSNNVADHPRKSSRALLSTHQRLTLAYMGSSMENKTLPAKNAGGVSKRPLARLSRPSTAVVLADARSHQRANGHTLGRASYGLTAEQKEERNRRVMETASYRKAQHERAMEETRRRKERGEVAFREWLRLKKQNQDLKPTECDPGSPIKNTATRTSNTGTESEESGSAFREWLHRKRIQKEEDRRLEELRLVHEQEMYSKKTREENEMAFKEWLLRKARRRSSHCGHRGPRFGIGNGHQFNEQHRKTVTQLSQKQL